MEKIIRKIKKLMAVANDPSASDQEIQLASYRAEKLMIKYKIDQKEILENIERTENDVFRHTLEKKYTGYLYWTFAELCKHNQCLSSYCGKINSKVELNIIGFKEDIELAKAIIVPIMDYMEEELKDLKECYIGYEDFRIFKRSWCSGFARGIKQQLDNALIEMKNDLKFDLAIIDLHPVLKSWDDRYITAVNSNFTKADVDAYQLGLKEGSRYNIKKDGKQESDTKLLEVFG